MENTIAYWLRKVSEQYQRELAFPENWSPVLFYRDLLDYPIASEAIFLDYFKNAIVSQMHYLKFFLKTRQQRRPGFVTANHQKLWQVFSHNGIMLYFEHVFLNLLEKETISSVDMLLLSHVELLSVRSTTEWSSIVEGFGACCENFFIKDPYAYLHLSETEADLSTSGKNPSDLSDKELLKSLDICLSNLQYPNISVSRFYDSRKKLLEIYSSKQNLLV